MPALNRCASCPELIPKGRSRCADCQAQAETKRGTATQRGYTGAGHQRFRNAVLAKHPICVLCRRARSTVADHHPLSRRDLERRGLDPNDPQHGRGLCKRCHDQETARHQPGGWNA